MEAVTPGTVVDVTRLVDELYATLLQRTRGSIGVMIGALVGLMYKLDTHMPLLPQEREAFRELRDKLETVFCMTITNKGGRV